MFSNHSEGLIIISDNFKKWSFLFIFVIIVLFTREETSNFRRAHCLNLPTLRGIIYWKRELHGHRNVETLCLHCCTYCRVRAHSVGIEIWCFVVVHVNLLYYDCQWRNVAPASPGAPQFRIKVIWLQKYLGVPKTYKGGQKAYKKNQKNSGDLFFIFIYLDS